MLEVINSFLGRRIIEGVKVSELRWCLNFLGYRLVLFFFNNKFLVLVLDYFFELFLGIFLFGLCFFFSFIVSLLLVYTF